MTQGYDTGSIERKGASGFPGDGVVVSEEGLTVTTTASQGRKENMYLAST